jgi:hypothetical protein
LAAAAASCFFALVPIGAVFAQSAPLLLPSGCGTANLNGGEVGSTSVNPAGQLCVGAAFGFSNLTGQATTTLKSGAGVLHTITVNTGAATETIAIFDSLTGSGTKIGTITVPASPVPVTLTYDAAFANGLTIVTAVASSDLTITFK